MPKYLVETLSIHRIRYVVEADEATHATDEVVMSNVKDEFSQKHLDEIVSSVREIDDQEYLRLFDEDNDYLSSWNVEEKFKFVHRIEY
jgi:hypothetical protein